MPSMPRCQFSLRALLILMLVAALASWTIAIRRRSAEFKLLAMDAADEVNKNLFFAEVLAAQDGRTEEEQRALARIRAAYFQQLQRKYEHAANRPWMTTEPDNPVPDFDDLR